jgi:ornithine cyclodeaminase
VKFLYLSQEEVISCGGLDMPVTIAAVEESFRLMHAGECIEPHAPLISWNGPHQRRITMHPAFIGGEVQVAGVKWTPSNPDNPIKRRFPRATGVILLSDPETGHPLAIMDGTAISAMRTGALAGLAAKWLARSNPEVIGLIGAGVIARTQLLGLAAARDGLYRAKVFDLNQEKARGFAREMSEKSGIEVEVVGSSLAAVQDADIVAPATNVGSSDRYIRAHWVKPGALLINVSINDYTSEAVQACDRVIVDHRKQLELSGMLLADMVTEGSLDASAVEEFAAVIGGERPGRTSDRERIFFSPMGMGVYDLINANRIYQVALKSGVGKTLELWKEPIWT